MKGATAIASILRAEGVDFVGCIPSHPLLDALALEDIRLIIPRQERVGINMVDGFSRVTNGRRTGVFLMQAQAGAENGFPGVAQAYDDSTPILLLPAGAPRDRAGVHPTFSPPRSFADVTKWADQVNMVQRIPEMFRRAFTSLRLVTSGYHMPRAMMEFRSAMPSATLVAHPVFPEHVKVEHWWRYRGTAGLIAGEFTKYLWALARRTLGFGKRRRTRSATRCARRRARSHSIPGG